MNKNVPAKTLKSVFKEFQIHEQIVADRFGDIIRQSFEATGAAPLRTSALELRETLFASSAGATVDHQIYTVNEPPEFQNSSGGALALCYDLTVPMVRWISQNANHLRFPFRRYQIQPVWRCEEIRSSRFSEFIQCDIDVVGDGRLDLITDAEMVSIANDIFSKLGIGAYEIRLSNRKLLEGFLMRVGVHHQRIIEAVVAIDDLAGLGHRRLRSEFETKFDLNASQIERVIRFLSVRGALEHVVHELSELFEDLPEHERYAQGLEEIKTVAAGAILMGVPVGNFVVDLSVARCFAYYTGTVIETVLTDHPGLGSICSGGRYDDLAGLFTDRKLPGVGISIGLTSLVCRLLQAGVLKTGPSTKASVLVTSQCRDALDRYIAVGTRLRASGVGTEIYLEHHGISEQLRYAKVKGFRFLLIADDEQLDTKIWEVKNLSTGQIAMVNDADVERFVGAHADTD
ncbi:histidine--tRNA ligase [Bradyrhizobium mercantei]|uniref:histidine--tRNA ligase n=1 Tax=Bradyrhizobium mercantei TaxID=1904807 RepID=UPI000978A506|nr:HisS family protein [Bradyrhizobium mercantei]